jgi:2OG-Fe(II) oxygenase superfamily
MAAFMLMQVLPAFNNKEDTFMTCIGQQFTWHYDAIQPHLKDSSGNRIATLIVYLNDCQEGGETVFRDLELKVCLYQYPVSNQLDYFLHHG